MGDLRWRNNITNFLETCLPSIREWTDFSVYSNRLKSSPFPSNRSLVVNYHWDSSAVDHTSLHFIWLAELYKNDAPRAVLRMFPFSNAAEYCTTRNLNWKLLLKTSNPRCICYLLGVALCLHLVPNKRNLVNKWNSDSLRLDTKLDQPAFSCRFIKLI